jgi:hypothetical protein
MIRDSSQAEVQMATSVSLLAHTKQPLSMWLFSKESRTSLNSTVQRRSETH